MCSDGTARLWKYPQQNSRVFEHCEPTETGARRHVWDARIAAHLRRLITGASDLRLGMPLCGAGVFPAVLRPYRHAEDLELCRAVIWDLDTGARVHVLTGHTEEIWQF